MADSSVQCTPDDMWACKICTYANKSNSLACKMCRGLRDASYIKSDSASMTPQMTNGACESTLTCLICGHNNPPHSENCSKCECDGLITEGEMQNRIVDDLVNVIDTSVDRSVPNTKESSNVQQDISLLLQHSNITPGSTVTTEKLEEAFNFNNNSDPRKQVWICKYCTYENNIIENKCSICDSTRKSAVRHSEQISTGSKKHDKSENRRFHAAQGESTREMKRTGDLAQKQDGLKLPDIKPGTSSISKCSLCHKPIGEIDNCCVCKQNRVAAASIASRLESFIHPVKNFFKQPVARIETVFVGPSMSKNTNNPEKQAPKKERAIKSNWTCVTCTLINKPSACVCSACATERLRVPFVDSGTWKCLKCTLNNRESSDKCRACRTPRRSPTSSCNVSKSLSDNLNDQSVSTHKQLRASKSDVSIHARHPLYENQTASLRSDKVEEMPASPSRMKLRRSVEDEAMERWQYITMFCKHNKEPFVDSDFAPSMTSISFDIAKPMTSIPIQWLRPSQISLDTGDNPKVKWSVCRTPMASDISQGILGNCWFLSALTVLTERPEYIESIIITRDYCEEGVYILRLCLDGNWTTVIIDDLLPCSLDGKLIFSKAHRKQLWVPLIEKAFAKLHGCYEALCAGKSIEGLMTLTGEPCDSIQLQSNNQSGDESCEVEMVWARLLSSRESGFLMGASCGGGNMTIEDDVYFSLGLRPRHAYAILDVQNVEDSRLLRLRNPWGTTRWNGEWSHESSKWNDVSQATRDRIQIYRSQDGRGMFWISLDDMLRYFDSIDICKIRKDWNESRVSGTFPDSCLQSLRYLVVTIFHTVEVELSLFQSGHRERESCPVDLCVLVHRYSQTVQRLVAVSKRQVRNVVACSCLLEPGQYAVVPVAFNKWMTGSTPVNYTVAVHSTKAIMVDQQEAKPQSPLLAEAIIQWTVAKGTRHEGQRGLTVYYLKKGWAGLIVVIENRQSHDYAHVKCDCTESYNVVSTRGSLAVVDCVPPLHRQVLILLSQVEGSQGYSISHRLVHRLSTSPTLGDWGTNNRQHNPPITPEVLGLHQPQPL